MRTYLEAKAMAKSLRAALAAKNVSLSHSECLELVSKQIGFNEWNMLSAKITLEAGERETPSPSSDVSLQPPVPVLAVASAVEAKKFYVEFLNFAVDWGWHENRSKSSVCANFTLWSDIAFERTSLRERTNGTLHPHDRPRRLEGRAFAKCT